MDWSRIEADRMEHSPARLTRTAGDTAAAIALAVGQIESLKRPAKLSRTIQ